MTEPAAEALAETENTLLRISSLTVTYPAPHRKRVVALSDVDLNVERGQTFALIGESGSGKTSLGQAICGLVPIAGGSITFDGVDLTQVPDGQWAAAAGRAGIAIVFQSPVLALDPRWPVWRSVAEGTGRQPLFGSSGQRKRALELMEMVGLPPDVGEHRPHELSGGQKQRVTIARALAGSARLIVLDEVVSALDVSIRNEILALLSSIKNELGLTYVFISHDMASVAQLATHIAVLYRGRVVESGPAAAVIHSPQHPYTRALIDAVPVLSGRAQRRQVARLTAAQDSEAPRGCVYRLRCWKAADACLEAPELREIQADHDVACHFPESGSPGTAG